METCLEPALGEANTPSFWRKGLNEALLDLRGSPMRYVPLESQMGAAVSKLAASISARTASGMESC
jgi:hypothetical protein